MKDIKKKIETIANIILGICAAGIVFISVGQLLVGGSKIFIVPIIGVVFWGLMKLFSKKYE